MILHKPSDAQVVANFMATSGTARYRDVKDAKKLVNVVDVYEGPYGEVKFVMDLWIATVDAIVFDPAMWKLRPYRNWRSWPLAVTGDTKQTQLLGEFGLSHRNFSDGALITDLQ